MLSVINVQKFDKCFQVDIDGLMSGKMSRIDKKLLKLQQKSKFSPAASMP